MKLSILIPTLPEEGLYLKRLMYILDSQKGIGHGDVEILTDPSPKNIPTGTKRNMLIERAKGEYFSQIDCDDTVPDYYILKLLEAIEQKPDVITFNGYMTTDGINRRDFTIKLGENYEERNGKYFRYPNHLCCYKKSVVEHIKFRPIWVQEDYFYATELRDKGILKTSVHIDVDMYHYDFIDKNKIKKSTNNLTVRRSRLR